MKKYCIIVCVFVMLMAGCGQKQLDLSLYNDDNKKLFVTLGESKEVIDGRLGAPQKIIDGRCEYEIGITVLYDNHSNACYVSCGKNSDFSLNNGIKIGDDIESVYETYNTTEPVVFVSNKDNERAIISKEKLSPNDVVDIYIMSFSTSVAPDAVDFISIGSYRATVFSEYNHNIQ